MKTDGLNVVVLNDVAQPSDPLNEWRWLAPLMALHLAITLPLAWLLNIWIDEASSLDTSSKGLRYALNQGIFYELQAPLYFVLLSAWRTLNHSIFQARLFSVICVALTLIAATRLVRRFLPTVHPIWVILALAFNPFIIWAATEIRVYALVLLLSSLLLQYFDDGYLGESSRRSHLVHAGLALVSLYTYYYLGFLLLAQAGALVLLRRWRSLWTYCLMMVAVGVGFTPMLVYIPQQTQGYTSALTQQPSLSTALRLLSWRLQEQLLPAYWPPTIAIARIIIAGLALLACGLLIGQVRQRIASSHIAMWTILVITMCCSLAAYLATAEAFLESRHTTIFLIPLTLSVFALLITTIRKQGVFIWAITVLAFSVASDAALYSHPAKTGDWARVAAYLKATERQGQPILVSQALSAVPLSYYYSGVNQLVPVPRPEDFRKFNSPDLVLKDERQLAELLAQTGSGGEVFWLVTDEMCELLGRDLNCHVLENFISKNYVVEQSQDFFRSRARLLRRKTPTQTAPSAN